MIHLTFIDMDNRLYGYFIIAMAFLYFNYLIPFCASIAIKRFPNEDAINNYIGTFDIRITANAYLKQIAMAAI
jgi:hypothetical protein